MVKVESEKELETYLAKSIKKNSNLNVCQQVKLGEYGIADILAWKAMKVDSSNSILAHIVEVKKGATGLEGLFQLTRYMKAVEMNFTTIKTNHPNLIDNVIVYGSLFCHDLVKAEEIGYLLAQMQNVFIYKYAISIENGIKSKRWAGWIEGVVDSKFHQQPLINSDQMRNCLRTDNCTNGTEEKESPYILFSNICV